MDNVHIRPLDRVLRTGLVALMVGALALQITAVNRARALQAQIDASIDPLPQVAQQIHSISDQERVVLIGTAADRLAELGGAALLGGRLPNSLEPVVGRTARADYEAEADLLAMSAQNATRGFETPVINTGFSLDMLDDRPAVAGGEEWQCLTDALYFEARGESLLGQLAVAEVILNRVDSKRFPGTVCGVVRQGGRALHSCQFSFYCDGQAERIHEPVAYARAGQIAAIMLEGRPRQLTDGATHYHTVSVNPRWARRLEQTAQIGVHVFYRRVTELALNEPL